MGLLHTPFRETGLEVARPHPSGGLFACQKLNNNINMKNKFKELFTLRIGRLKYFVQLIVVSTLLSLQDQYGVLETLFGTLLADLISVLLMVYSALLVVQRLNDLGWSRWIILAPIGGMVLVSVVPPAGLVVGPMIVIFLGVPLLFKNGREINTDTSREKKTDELRNYVGLLRSGKALLKFDSIKNMKNIPIGWAWLVVAIVGAISYYWFIERPDQIMKKCSIYNETYNKENCLKKNGL